MSAPYFGESWHVPALVGAEQADTPVGEPCLHCDEPIRPEQQGFLRPVIGSDGQTEVRPIHRECDLRAIVGGLHHQLGTCTCEGGSDDPDPPWATRREAALLAWAYFYGAARSQ